MSSLVVVSPLVALMKDQVRARPASTQYEVKFFSADDPFQYCDVRMC